MSECHFYVYLHRRADDGRVFYVGKGKARRAYARSGRSELWSRIVNKHGCKVEIVEDCLSESDAFQLEAETIRQYDGLCNFTDGGEGISGYHHTEEARQAISAAHKGRPHKPEHIEARAQKLRGKKRSAEFCKELGDRMRGSKRSDEVRRRMSESRKGLKRDAEVIKKVADWHRGKKRTQESRERMSNASTVKRAVVCKSTGSVFGSLEDAAQWLRNNGWEKATKTGVWFSASGKRKKSYGLEWSYV